QISIDGATTYSPIICAAEKQSNVFTLNRQNKTLTFSNIEKYSVEIYNIHGLLILKSSSNIISLAMLPHGMYSIIIQTDQKTFQQKMIW
ncbi:MAG: T9SS type A sorting domain-containing protein, partial [Bacteroidales bacterium]|nr:T9SS type A sorting domain-containing protein [Bacteroidales bacterium]